MSILGELGGLIPGGTAMTDFDIIPGRRDAAGAFPAQRTTMGQQRRHPRQQPFGGRSTIAK